jgi:2-oxoisovalerate dehydrogenase E1 component
MAVALAAKRNLRASPEALLQLYRSMLRIRHFEERATELFKSGTVKGTAHSYAGEEAIAAGACLDLTADDFIGSYHRGHGHCIAKGARLDRMMAELMGRETGYCRGLGGSMHIADPELNILGANGIVGASMPIGVGAALAAKLRGTRQVVIAFFGDGAANQGIFHEALNLAGVWQLPIIFVCENNQYALNTPYQQTTAVAEVAQRAGAYSMPGRRIDGNDAEEVYAVVGEAIARARRGEGPSLIEAMTWRWGPHSMRANLREPRNDEDMEAWRQRDPIKRLETRLAEEKVAAEQIAAVSSAVEAEIAAAIAFAKDSPEPSVEILSEAVYAPHVAFREPEEQGARELTFPQALNEALDQEMARDPTVFLMGEDIAETGGIFQVTRGLVEKYGRGRVRDTPISEAGFCGAGLGAAAAGLRPVIEVQIFDFVTLMMDMIVNQAAKFRFMMGGRPKVPLVIRGPQGGGIRLAAQHSQSLEAWFTHIPGLVVVAPSTPYDAKGLLTAAIRDDNPVIFLEHKMLYLGGSGPVPEQPYAIPIGKADVKRHGTDVTIVATQLMVSRALSAAVQLEREGISVEVIDPRTLRPLDEATILESVRRTNRLVVVHEACTRGGFGAEVAAMVVEHAFDWLDAPVVRVGALDTPMPFNDRLESAVIPSQERIAAAVRALFR